MTLAELAQAGRTPSPALCVVIERESGGVVPRQDTRPDDWRDIWPELHSSEPVTQPAAL